MIVEYRLNGGVAEVDDEFGAELLGTGAWVEQGEAQARKPRAARAKVVPAEPEE